MTIGLLNFLGSNCEQDCADAITHVLGQPVRQLWYQDVPDLSGLEGVILPGGFSYGDYLRSGALAALAPVVRELEGFIAQGRWVLGICNGFQILTEAGCLPGALIRNSNQQFICQQRCQLTVATTRTPFTRGFSVGQTVEFPIAHADGCYTLDPEAYQRLCDNDQVVLRYAQPVNGSVGGVAGVCNVAGNVVGLMPHPERNLQALPNTGATGDGAAWFAHALASVV
jgi:phosphoribosylformylglycinamidine synthase